MHVRPRARCNLAPRWRGVPPGKRFSRNASAIRHEMVHQIVPLVLLHTREDMDTETMQPFIGSTWHLIQNVVIAKTPGHQPASLEVRGQIASILAAMDAATIMKKRFEALARPDSLERLRAGELDTDAKRKKLLDAYAEELDVKETEWSNSQVSVVAGAGFEPAAFRL